MIPLIAGLALFAALTYVIRRIFGTPKVPSDAITSEHVRNETLIEGTRNKPW
jgi:hypothetical protein